MEVQVITAAVEFFHRSFLKPLQLSSDTISEITEARASVTVRVGGKEATGRGAIYLSDLWAWREGALTHAERDQALRRLCTDIAAALPAMSDESPGHPLELGLKLQQHVAALSIPTDPSALARLMCASPFDAAIHDAAGYALHRSAFDFYRDPAPLPSADRYFTAGNACAAIHSVLLASRIHPQNGIELNSPQHTPSANAEWLPGLAPTDGYHRVSTDAPLGLGSRLHCV